ncbi:efflux RND transporter permease subunit [Pseudomonas sp. MYb185]|uniref:efflux RND transporter permease subunit n=1 Tax=Pseudomonas sp. MYb185 TaxID=1848729 RepID=UPI000CFD33FD|nr:efflux RND transporter permease subunit [Pseudomonas sp. MYb185]PRB80023.1 acriflavine resistance protein B [Pseudomonas sp. MYb185]
MAVHDQGLGWFIRRPVATVLLGLAITLLGLFALPRLSIAPLPEVDFPNLQVNALLPGASPEVMASAVATPLEVQLSQVPGIREMTSSSSLGNTSIQLQFELNKPLDTAVQEVQAAINNAAGQLPAEMPAPPSWRKLNPAQFPVLLLGLQSDLMTSTALSDVVENLVVRQLSQVDGVADIRIFGQQKPAIRVQVKPEQLAASGLTMADIRQALQQASLNFPKGALYGEQRVVTLAANDQIFTADQYGALVVGYQQGAALHLRDVAEVVVGSENAYISAHQNGKPALTLAVLRQPGANMVETAERIRALLPGLREQLPSSVNLEVMVDRTVLTRASLHDVALTLAIAILLVVAVMGLYLRSWGATLVVASVLGVSLFATLAVMYVLGFSLNNLTLMALVVAVGFVVDDAIVVIENIHRYREQGLSPFKAALAGANEMGFTLVAITLSLIAAFLPLLLMDGVVGRLLREFSITLATTVVISMMVSLTLAPSLIARFRHQHRTQADEPFGVRLYARTLAMALDHGGVVLVFFALTVVAGAVGYWFIPKDFFPEQDATFLQGSSIAAQDISYPEMRRKHQQLSAILQQDPDVDVVFEMVGVQPGTGQTLSRGRFWISLRDISERQSSAQEIVNRLRPQLAAVPGISLLNRPAQDISMGGGRGPVSYQYLLRGTDAEQLYGWASQLTEQLHSLPQFSDVSDDLQMGAAVQHLRIDRDAAAHFGVTVRDVDQLLFDSFGQRSVNEYQTEVNQYKVILELAEPARGSLASTEFLKLRSQTTGQLVPLSSVVREEPVMAGPVVINRSGLAPAVTISFNLAAGVSLGEAVKVLEKAQQELIMPDQISGAFSGSAQVFKESQASQGLLILAALLAVYIILGVLYESLIHPLTIISTLPSAGVGALLLLSLVDMTFSLVALIGVLLLIGIVKKNGILLVDYAIAARREQGLSPRDAIYQACLTRFRPIMMTTLAALLGALPLLIGFGHGSEIRQPLGVTIVGGLLLSQLLTLYSTPVIYLKLEQWGEGRRRPAPAAVMPLSNAV